MSLKIFGVYGLLGVVLLLAGCGDLENLDPGVTVTTHTAVRDAYSFDVKTIDGRTIPCVWVYNGLSCDWSKQ